VIKWIGCAGYSSACAVAIIETNISKAPIPNFFMDLPLLQRPAWLRRDTETSGSFLAEFFLMRSVI
jgi:hypothetical protein